LTGRFSAVRTGQRSVFGPLSLDIFKQSRVTLQYPSLIIYTQRALRCSSRCNRYMLIAHSVYYIIYVHIAPTLPVVQPPPTHSPSSRHAFVLLSLVVGGVYVRAYTPIWRRSKGHCLNGSAPVMDRKTHAFVVPTVSPGSPESVCACVRVCANARQNISERRREEELQGSRRRRRGRPTRIPEPTWPGRGKRILSYIYTRERVPAGCDRV